MIYKKRRKKTRFRPRKKERKHDLNQEKKKVTMRVQLPESEKWHFEWLISSLK